MKKEYAAGKVARSCKGHGQAVLCFDLRKCRKVGWHGRAGRHGGTVLYFDFEISGNSIWHGRALWHGGTVQIGWSSKLDAVFFGVYILACGMYLGTMWVTNKPWL